MAGPFDLGTVVVRSAALPRSRNRPGARGLRSPADDPARDPARPALGRGARSTAPASSLNPTNCDPIRRSTGSVTSLLGPGRAALPALPGRRLQGARLQAEARASPLRRRPTAAPTRACARSSPPSRAKPTRRRISVALPRSEFLDQAHIRTVCTRVQFAADQCPAGSVYGHVKAITPAARLPARRPGLPALLLPRAARHGRWPCTGPPSQPIEIDAVGRIDSVNGGIRSTFETVPDAPVTKVDRHPAGRQEGPLSELDQHLQRAPTAPRSSSTAKTARSTTPSPVLKANCAKKGKGKGAQAAQQTLSCPAA